MHDMVCKFLVLFMKREHVPEFSIKALTNLKSSIQDCAVQVSDRRLSVGEFAYNHLQQWSTKRGCKYWLDDLFKKLRKGYVSAVQMLLTKLPLDNKTILHLSCLDPRAVLDDHLSTHPSFFKFLTLAMMLPNVVDQEEMGVFDDQVRNYTTDRAVHGLARAYDLTEDNRIDRDFWSGVCILKNPDKRSAYLHLSRLAKALLSVFSGPLVEASFNLMDDIIEADRTNMTVENYEATAIIQSSLKTQNRLSTEFEVTPVSYTHLTLPTSVYV